jgi:cephalosporin-C deacetylase
MPIVDMPLDKLKTYQGRNPRPADFDDFWERSLAELGKIDPAPKLVPSRALSASFADCYDLFFTSTFGARIHAHYVRPRNAKGRVPAVLQFHGYSGSAGDWYGKLGFAAQGFAVAAMDCRGQGGQSTDPGGVTGATLRGHIIRGLDDAPEKMLFRNIYLDTAQLARVVMSFDEVDPERVGAMGISQGGGLTLACAALVPGIRRAAPVFPFLCDYRRVWEMDLSKNAYEELRWYFRNYDPRHEREEEVFTKLGYVDCQHLAPRIRAEVVMATGLMDDVCPPSTQFAAYNKIASKKRMVIYPDFTHESLPGFTDETFNFMTGLSRSPLTMIRGTGSRGPRKGRKR